MPGRRSTSVTAGTGRPDRTRPPPLAGGGGQTRGVTLRVTAVCSGNICRSPIAEVVLREHLDRAGLGHAVVVDSAGIGAWHLGDPADRRTVAVLRRHGYDGSSHRAAQITRAWIDADDAPDLLLAMDATHLRDLQRLAPETPVHLVREFDPAADPDDLDVPDPYYGADSGFDDVLAMIEAAVPGVIAHLRTSLAASKRGGYRRVVTRCASPC
jgi:protein-tyrosine phosphatase